jgi:hypothetical protein
MKESVKLTFSHLTHFYATATNGKKKGKMCHATFQGGVCLKNENRKMDTKN